MQYLVPILQKTMLADDTAEVVFDISKTLFRYNAGQYATITLPALEGYPITDQFHDFSIASSPNDHQKLTIAFRISGSVFKTTLLGMKIGDEVLLEGPKGILTLPPTSQRAPLVFIAGGIGITPFLSMLRYATEAKLPLDITVYHVLSTRRSAPYQAELKALAKHNSHIAVYPHTGRLNFDSIAGKFPDPKTLWYVAGSPNMVKTMQQELLKRGIFNNQLRAEEFTGYEEEPS